jgi:hypothetical protein
VPTVRTAAVAATFVWFIAADRRMIASTGGNVTEPTSSSATARNGPGE